ncbi:hypothetical protein O0L34_g6359 [Tuta absoluta]|nr:hypothetical protein O0L34_g6359 [Tuta absoluta]
MWEQYLQPPGVQTALQQGSDIHFLHPTTVETLHPRYQLARRGVLLHEDVAQYLQPLGVQTALQQGSDIHFLHPTTVETLHPRYQLARRGVLLHEDVAQYLQPPGVDVTSSPEDME